MPRHRPIIRSRPRRPVAWRACAALLAASLGFAALGARGGSPCPRAFTAASLARLRPAALASLAGSGCVSAQVYLGLDYVYGRDVRRDPVRAISWLRRAASAGNAYAQYTVADMYAGGQGVERSWSKAAYWYRRAAEQGSVYAQGRLGALYAQGRGVAQDRVSALMWLDLAGPSQPRAAKRLKSLKAQATPRQWRRAKAQARAWRRRHGG